METRVCRTCGVEKNLIKENWKISYVKKNGTPSFNLHCRPCMNKKILERKAAFEFDYSNINYNEIRKCTKCGKAYNLKNFTKDKWRKDGFTSHCNPCRKVFTQKYIKENPNYYKDYYSKNAEKEKIRRAKWVENNRDRVLEQSKEWYQNNKERKIKTTKKWVINNKEKFLKNQRDYKRNRQKTDPIYKLAGKIRSRMYLAFKKKRWHKNGSNEKMLGIDYESAKLYIESLFKKNMSWDNHGEWHIDHIIPLASADSEAELIALSYYKNLQPLWATENKSKNDDYDPKEKEEYLKWYNENVAK
jgi:hypothetical protein